MQTVRVLVAVLASLCLITLVSSQSGTVIALSQSDIQLLLDLHNSVRTTANLTASGKVKLPPPSSSLPLLTWDANLANVWGTGYANNCVFAHTNSAYRSSSGGKGSNAVGENLSWAYATDNQGKPVRIGLPQLFTGWYGEHKDYTFAALGADGFNTGGQTGHYTQLIWGQTTSVGCAYIDCDGVQGGVGRGQMLACDYYNAGNFYGRTPYGCTGFVQQCSVLGSACQQTYSDFCPSSSSSSSTVVNTVCACGDTGTTVSNSPTTSPSVTPAPSRSTTASISNAPSTTTTASLTNTAAPSNSATNAPSTSSVPSVSSIASQTSNPSSSTAPSLAPGASSSSTSTSSQTSVPSQTNNPSFSSSVTSVASQSNPASQSSVPSSTASASPAPPCVPRTCGTLTCGSYSDLCGGTITCGTCTSGNTCVNGVCNPTGCSPACLSVSQVCLASGVCACAPGYTLTGTGRCENALALSGVYPFIPYFNNNPNYWVKESATSVASAEINNIDTVSGQRRSITWVNSNQFSSNSNTTITSQVYTGSQTVSFGIGFRLNQNENGRFNDSIEWRFDVSNGKVTPHWIMYYYGGFNDIYVISASPWSTTDWNNVTIKSYVTSDNRLNFVIVINGAGGNNYYYTDSTYYPNIGSVYFSGNAPFGIRKLAVSTGTTLTVSVTGCMSASDWQNFVSSILGSGVTIDQYQANAGCTLSGSRKRQSGVEPLTVFTFTIADSAAGQTSSGLASKFLGMAAVQDPVFASQGVSVESASVVLPANTFAANSILVAAPAGAIVPAAAGLSTGAIVGIVVGGTAAVLLGAGALAAIAVVGVIAVRKATTKTYKNEVQMETVEAVDEEKAVAPKQKKREGIDVFDPVERKQSVTGRTNIN